MDPLVHPRDQGTIETVDFTRQTCFEEGEDCAIGQKDYGHRFLEFTSKMWRDIHRLPGEGHHLEKRHRALLCRIIAPIRPWIAEKGPHSAKKNAPPPWQRTGSHLRRRHGQIGRIRLRTAALFTVFSRFGPARLLFVSKLEKDTRRAEIWVEWRGYRRYGGLLCRPPENVFFRRVEEVGASLGQVYRAKRRLCWEINRHFSKIFDFVLYAKNLSYFTDCPRNCKFPVKFCWFASSSLTKSRDRINKVFHFQISLLASCLRNAQFFNGYDVCVVVFVCWLTTLFVIRGITSKITTQLKRIVKFITDEFNLRFCCSILWRVSKTKNVKNLRTVPPLRRPQDSGHRRHYVAKTTNFRNTRAQQLPETTRTTRSRGRVPTGPEFSKIRLPQELEFHGRPVAWEGAKPFACRPLAEITDEPEPRIRSSKTQTVYFRRC